MWGWSLTNAQVRGGYEAIGAEAAVTTHHVDTLTRTADVWILSTLITIWEKESHRHHIKWHIKNWSEFTLTSGAMWLRAELSSELFPSSHVTYFWRHHCLFPVKHESCCFFLFYQLWYLSNSNMRWDMSDTHSPTHCCVGVCRYPGLHSQRKLPGTFRQTAFCWHTGPFWHSSISTHTRHKHT